MAATFRSLTVEDFARLFGVSPAEFEPDCRRAIEEADFRHRPLDPVERDETVADVQRRIDSGDLATAGRGGFNRWEEGWKENLESFKESHFDPKALVPKYVRPNQPLRLEGHYVQSPNQYFELDVYTVLRLWLFGRYVGDVNHVYEFACGPGYNLHLLASKYPGKGLTGLDWAPSAVELVNLIGEKHGMSIVGQRFDMFRPDHDFRLAPGSLALTCGGLEQLGEDFRPFIDYLIAQSPARITHIEPIYELYREEDLLDSLAMRFHRARKYLLGLLPYLHECENAGQIEIERIHRLRFGSLFHDGWSMIVYRPMTTGGQSH